MLVAIVCEFCLFAVAFVRIWETLAQVPVSALAFVSDYCDVSHSAVVLSWERGLQLLLVFWSGAERVTTSTCFLCYAQFVYVPSLYLSGNCFSKYIALATSPFLQYDERIHPMD